jgi:long-chain acyl-CoA synthetase
MAQIGFWHLAQQHPEQPALVDPDGTRVTAGELLAAANRVVHGLRALGLKPGDAVATVLENERAMIEIALATAQAGLFLTPINHHLTASEIGYIVEDCDARAVVCSPSAADVTRKAAAKVPASALFSTGDAPGFRAFTELTAGQPSTLPDERRVGLVMNYTSGTTGKPKGVRRAPPEVPPDTVAERYAQFLMLFGMKPLDGTHLVVSPLYHTAVLSFCMNHLHLGHRVVLMTKWSPEGMLAVVERERVTNSHMVPTHFNRLLALPDEIKKRHDLSSLRHVVHSAAPCPVDVKRKMLAWWGPVIYEYYAASEGGGTLATPDEWLKHPGTVGRAWPMSEIRVVRDDGEPCAPREVGAVFMKMAGYKFEYYKDKGKTDQAWKDGFFTVGDAGYLDEEGYLFLCDRKADMIISGGVNIYPAEIEAVLTGHPAVGDVAVFGIPDDDWGEQVKAVIELHEGVQPSSALVEEILAYCGEHLAKHKQPKTIDFTKALPRDPSGKLYKRKLRDPYWQGRDRAI